MKRSRLLPLVLVIAATVALAGFTLQADEKKAAEEKKPQTVCAVMGGKINKEVYTDFQGQRVYFCCPMCKPAFVKDPETYMKKFEEGGILLESVQTACPLTGREIDKTSYSDYKGRRVYFCCDGCKAPFAKDPEKHLKKLDESAKGHAKEHMKDEGHGSHDHGH